MSVIENPKVMVYYYTVSLGQRVTLHQQLRQLLVCIKVPSSLFACKIHKSSYSQYTKPNSNNQLNSSTVPNLMLLNQKCGYCNTEPNFGLIRANQICYNSSFMKQSIEILQKILFREGYML